MMGFVVFGLLNPCFTASAKNNVEYDMQVDSITIKNTHRVTKSEILRLLPELNNKKINIKKLSKNIQIINDSGAISIKVQFVPSKDGKYNVFVLAEDGKRENYNIGVNNTGDDYTGNWRTNLTYVNNDVSQNGDSLGVTYVTSPNHLQEVHQAMVNYKFLLPKIGDTISFGYSYSNSDMGQIADIYGLGLYAVGKSSNYGLHYQHNIKYTKKNKKVIDVGIDYKNFDGQHELRIGDYRWAAGGYDFSETVLSLGYTESIVMNNSFLTYNFGYSQNLKGNKEAYNNYRTGSDDIFHVFKGSLNYQHYLDNKWILVGNLEGQYSNDDLLGTEQFSLGGVGSIRGLKSGAGSGDKGYKMSLEAYTPEVFHNGKFVVFTDFGHTFNNHNNIGEVSKTMTSYGLGYRFNDKRGLYISLDYAKVTKHSGVSDSYRLPWHLNIVKTF